MMKAWVFQGSPDKFDVEGYLSHIRFLFSHAIVFLVLCACVPMSANPPPTPMPEQAMGEVGFGVNRGMLFDSDGVITDRKVDFFPNVPPMANLRVAVRVPTSLFGTTRFGLDKHHEVGLVGSLGNPELLSAGGYLRYSIVRDDGVSVGLQLDGGLLWAGASLPLAYRITGSFWLTTMPGMRASAGHLVAHLPVGMGWQLNDAFRIDAEVGSQAHWYKSSMTDWDFTYWYDYAVYGSLGVSYAR